MSTLCHGIPDGYGGLPVSTASAARVLPAEPVSVPTARRFAADALASWGLDGVVSDTVQVVAELAANAVREGERSSRPEILLRLACSPQFVFVQAGDHNPAAPPAPAAPGARSAEHGRGLTITQALSRQLAWYQEGPWKIVWAAIPIPAAASVACCERQGRAA
jgi:anti-sigma regulatory factor (Ser/Thr protein kinase)